MLVFFVVTRVVSLRMPDGTYPALTRLAAIRRRGNVIRLNPQEIAQAARPGIPVEDILGCCLLVPVPYAALLASGRWSVIAVPDEPSSSLCVPWDILHLASPPLKTVFGQEAPARLAYQEIADSLRIAFSNAADNAERARLEGLVVSAQALADDTNPDM